jgi:hypothetical protein
LKHEVHALNYPNAVIQFGLELCSPKIIQTKDASWQEFDSLELDILPEVSTRPEIR